MRHQCVGWSGTLPKKKEPQGSVGIKNSWKYEKDLIIFNIISVIFTITRLADMIILYRLIKNNRKSMLFCMNLKKQKINLNE